jgi:hypothetical protein
VISSQAEFLGVKFAPLYQDAKGNFAALADIDRREIIRIYDDKIRFNLSLINTLLDSAQSSAEPLSAMGKLKQARSIYRVTGEYVTMAVTINSGAVTQYKGVSDTGKQIDDAIEKYRASLTASVAVNRDQYQRIKGKLSELLEARGFTITDRNPVYAVTLTVQTEEEPAPAYQFVRSSVDIQIALTKTKAVVFSYHKNLPRYGHSSLEGAYNRAYLNIEEDLEGNFIKEFNLVFGN